MKKSIIISAIVILVMAVVGGLIYYNQFLPKPLEKVKYGFSPFPGTLPYLVAKDEGFFKEEGIDVEIVYEDYLKVNEDVATGAVDFHSQYVLIDVVYAVSKGEDLAIVMATDYSNGVDAIVAKKEIQTVSDLKGKKIGVDKGTLSEYLLADALKKSNLELSDVIEVGLSSLDAADAFIRGEVDAAVSWEPDVNKAVVEGNGWRLYTSADSPGLIVDCLVFRSEFVTKYPEKVLAVVRGYMKAMDFIAENPNQAYAIGAKYSGITASEFEIQYPGLKQVGLEDNQHLMTYGTGIASLHGLINEAYDFLEERGFVEQAVDSTEIIHPQFIRALTE